MPRAEFDTLADRELRAIVAELKAGLRDLARKGGAAIPETTSADGLSRTFDQMIGVRRKAALEEAIGRLEDEITARIGTAMDSAGAAAAAEAATANAGIGSPGVGLNVRAIATARASAASEVRGILDSTRQRLNTAITQGLSGRLTAAELSDAIAASFEVPQSVQRIERILRTELGGIWMASQAEVDEILADTGPDLIKRWVTVGGKHGDGRNRVSHLLMHGQERELDETFNVGGGASASTPPGAVGFPAKAPLDAGLPAGERINCRCRFVRVPRSEAVQPYIKARRDPSRAGAPDDMRTG